MGELVFLATSGALVLPLVFAAPPAAQPEAMAAEISASLQRGRVGESLRLAEEALAAHPKQPVVGLSAAQVLMAVADWPRALELIERAVELAPEAPEPNYMLAVWSVSQGDFTTARAATTKALEVAPGYQPAHELMAELDLRDAIRRGDRGEFPEGSPEARVLEIAGRVIARDWDGLTSCCVDETLKERLTDAETRSLLGELVAGFSTSHAGEPVGYAVQPALMDQSLAMVPVFVAVERHGDPAAAEAMEHALDHPVLGRMLLPEERMVVEGLDPPQRSDYFARVAGETRHSLDAVVVELSRDADGSWLLSGAALGLEEPPRLRLSEVLEDPSGLEESSASEAGDDGEDGDDDEIPLWVYGLGTLVFAGGICFYIVLGEQD